MNRGFTYEVPMPRLDVALDGATVVITLTVDVLDRVFRFDCPAGSPWAAQLLRLTMQDQLRRAMERARADAYEAGWRDARAKRPKRVSFWGRLP